MNSALPSAGATQVADMCDSCPKQHATIAPDPKSQTPTPAPVCLSQVFISKGVTLVPLEQMVAAITVNRKARAAIGKLC
jgi:hypothetical protein